MRTSNYDLSSSQAQQPRSDEGYLSKTFNGSNVEAQFFSGDPRVVVVDDVLEPAALASIRSLLEVETIWHETKSPLMAGYVGAYVHNGLHGLPFLALYEDLRRALAQVFNGHKIRFL